MKKPVFVFCFLFALLLSGGAQTGDPYRVEARLEEGLVVLHVTIPDQHYLYADYFKVTDAVGNEQQPVSLPEAAFITDPNSGKPKPVFNQSFTASYQWNPADTGAGAFLVQYWGCNDSVCFIPQTKVVELSPGEVEPVKDSARVADKAEQPVQSDWQKELEDFQVVAVDVGYKKPADFIDFIENGTAVDNISGFKFFLTDPVAFVRESGLAVTILFILLGGLALNLTPCVLPMIPINLAIIGAGAQAGSKSRGFALGAAYGAGIALVYGLLGSLIVLTGSRFGTIQANPWFNLVIALIFVVLALAMFDVIHIDFSRFQSKVGGGEHKQGSFVVAITMGSVAALLAGACVAPVVISVLLLATSIGPEGLILPFVLGFGMALPWPFAGAGLSFLPKPGKWMEYVKYGFGVGIIFFAFYYGHLSYRAFRPSDITSHGEVKGHLIVDGTTNEGLADALRTAKVTGTPVLIDFWASWCKNCLAMDKTTYKDEAVKARLKNYTFIKYVAEDFDHENTKAVMDHFSVQGLPTFIVLKAR